MRVKDSYRVGHSLCKHVDLYCLTLTEVASYKQIGQFRNIILQAVLSPSSERISFTEASGIPGAIGTESAATVTPASPLSVPPDFVPTRPLDPPVFESATPVETRINPSISAEALEGEGEGKSTGQGLNSPAGLGGIIAASIFVVGLILAGVHLTFGPIPQHTHDMCHY